MPSICTEHLNWGCRDRFLDCAGTMERGALLFPFDYDTGRDYTASAALQSAIQLKNT